MISINIGLDKLKVIYEMGVGMNIIPLSVYDDIL